MEQRARNQAIICQYCQQAGQVIVKRIQVKTFMSLGKVILAVITWGISLIFVGYTRREDKTQATCASCSSSWIY